MKVEVGRGWNEGGEGSGAGSGGITITLPCANEGFRGSTARNRSVFVMEGPASGHLIHDPGCSLSYLERPSGTGNWINSHSNVSRP